MKKQSKGQSNLLKGIFDVYHEPLVVTDLRGNVVSVNHRMEELTGFAKSELQNYFLPRLVHHQEEPRSD